ncbi:hypothetical protein VR41_12120 [Streptomyces sp. NRRL B-1568]|nr:hypothetical protein VR41_12120 [Streptomyces sp. NRRL B-1568]
MRWHGSAGARRRPRSSSADQRRQETTARTGGWKAGDLSVCGTCHADDVAREKADAAWEPAPAQPEPEDDRDREPGRRCGLFRRRP